MRKRRKSSDPGRNKTEKAREDVMLCVRERENSFSAKRPLSPPRIDAPRASAVPLCNALTLSSPRSLSLSLYLRRPPLAAMPRPMSTAESSFILRALGEGLRIDGRRPRESRPLSVACGYLVEPTRNARKGPAQSANTNNSQSAAARPHSDRHCRHSRGSTSELET